MSRTPWSATRESSSQAAWTPTRAFPTSSTGRARIILPARSIRAWSERSSFSNLVKNETKTGLVVAVTLAALAISGGAVFVGSGVYDIGADDHHTKVVLTVIEQLRERSIAARTRRLEILAVYDPARIPARAP